MAILAGIDEAGYGPLLGPLVVSSAVVSIPEDLLKTDLWHALSGAVARGKKHLAGRLLITDSKKAYTRASGPVHLRKTVLASLGCISDQIPETAGQLVAALSPDCSDRLVGYPWYADLAQQPLGGNGDDVALASAVLQKTMDANDVRLLNISARCLDVGYFNQMVSAVKNKAGVLFTELCGLIEQAFQYSPSGGMLQVIVDRQGGRINYRQELCRMFPDMQLKILRQDCMTSSYEMHGGGRAMRIHFTVKADDRFLPVALASMTSKYLREVLIEGLNRYFLRHYGRLKPTAGYWQDGNRFIKDLETHLPNLKYDSQMLIRSR